MTKYNREKVEDSFLPSQKITCHPSMPSMGTTASCWQCHMESSVAHEHSGKFYIPPELLNLCPEASQKSMPQSSICESDLKLTEINFLMNR